MNTKCTQLCNVWIFYEFKNFLKWSIVTMQIYIILGNSNWYKYFWRCMFKLQYKIIFAVKL